MKKLFLLFILIVSVQWVKGQVPHSTNTLLWRISGNGLGKPSYLYGTMHLTDKRIFQLGDSLYQALEKTEGFAAELDMNRLGNQLIKYFMDKEESTTGTQTVKNAVSPQTWERYRKALEKKFNKKADQITVDDLEEVENKLQTELFRKGDMPTFLDAYLFGLARKQGKWVGGLEELGDQLEHIEAEDIEEKIQTSLFDDEYYRGSMEWLIKLYTAQRLDSIDAYMYRAETGTKDYIMIKRNLKMARGMDSLSAIRSTLFAVGAAHLPGDSGVIALLRSRGFTVSPVISSRKISPEKYVSGSAKADWVPVAVKDNVYRVQMPGDADPLPIFETLGLEMKMYFDISYMRMYMTMNLEVAENRKKLGPDSLFNSIRQQYGKQGMPMKEKKVLVNGLEGREFIFSSPDGEYRLQAFLPDTAIVIMNGIFAFNNKSLSGEDAERFFQSFVYNKDRVKPPPVKMTWSRKEYPQHAFSIESPVALKETKDKDAGEEGKVTYNYQAMDMKNQVFYGLSVISMEEGMYDSGDDTTYFLAIKDGMKERFDDSKILDSSYFNLEGFPGYKFTISGKSDGSQLETSIISLSRGNRSYYLFGVYEPLNESRTAAHRFLNSFALLPYPYPEWKAVRSPDGSYSTLSAFPLREKPTGEGDIHPGAQRMIVFDTLASVSMYIDKTILPTWFWYSSDTAFLRERSTQYVGTGDTVTGYAISELGSMRVLDFQVEKPGDHVVKRVKILLNGNEIYELFGSLARQDLARDYHRFYDAFRVNREIKNDQFTIPKPAAVAEAIKQLKGKEETKELLIWWKDLAFTHADLPVLQTLLLDLYPDFDSTWYANLNKRIFEKVEWLDTAHTTIQYLRDNYSKIDPRDEYVKPYVISYLSRITTSESYELIRDFLVNYSYSIDEPAYFQDSFDDSLELSARLFPGILKWADSKSIGYRINGLVLSLLDSNLLDRKVLIPYASKYISMAREVLKKEKEDIENEAYYYHDLIKILGFIRTPETIAQLKKFTAFDDRGLKFVTQMALIGAGQPADTRILYTLATTDEYRHDLYDELKRMGKLNLFPREFANQKQLAQSKLYEYASEEDMTPRLQLVGERTVLYKGQQQKFYLFKANSEEFGGEALLGVAGPYPLNAKDLSSTHAVTGLYWDKEYDGKKLDTLLKEYLEWLEEE